jgi:hypothetical protein
MDAGVPGGCGVLEAGVPGGCGVVEAGVVDAFGVADADVFAVLGVVDVWGVVAVLGLLCGAGFTLRVTCPRSVLGIARVVPVAIVE